MSACGKEEQVYSERFHLLRPTGISKVSMSPWLCHKFRRLAERSALHSVVDKSKACGWQNLVNQGNRGLVEIWHVMSTGKSRHRENPFYLVPPRWTVLYGALFLRYPVWVDGSNGEGVEDCPLFTMKEFEEAALIMKNKNTLGPSLSLEAGKACADHQRERRLWPVVYIPTARLLSGGITLYFLPNRRMGTQVSEGVTTKAPTIN